VALDLGVDRFQGLIEKFAKLPRAYRIAAIPLIAGVILGGYGWLFYKPAHAQLVAIEAQERDLERKVSEVRAIVANLAAFEQELTELEAKLKQALRQLPDSKELPGLLTDVSSLGKDAGLEFKAFRPQDEVNRDFYAEVPIEVEFSGDYHDIARFFDKVSKLPRIVNVSELNMELANADADETRLKVKGEATTFRFIEHHEPAPEAGAPAAGKKPAAAPAAHGGKKS
jgi:type IV pilus assembly protein PilO